MVVQVEVEFHVGIDIDDDATANCGGTAIGHRPSAITIHHASPSRSDLSSTMTHSVAVTARMRRFLAIAIFLSSSALICTGFAPKISVRGRAIASSASVGRSSLTVAPTSIPLVSSLMMNTMDSLTATSYGDSEMVLASSSIILSETEAWVQPLSFVLGPFLTFFSFAMVRIHFSLFPSIQQHSSSRAYSNIVFLVPMISCVV